MLILTPIFLKIISHYENAVIFEKIVSEHLNDTRFGAQKGPFFLNQDIVFCFPHNAFITLYHSLISLNISMILTFLTIELNVGVLEI